jgi:hypothetical protein
MTQSGFARCLFGADAGCVAQQKDVHNGLSRRVLRTGQDDADRLRTSSSDEERLEIVQAEIEETWDEEWLCEVDKAWDAIHRCLTDGSLTRDAGSTPLNLCVLGKFLFDGDDYLMILIDPQQVRDVASAIADWDEARLRSGYERISEADYGGEKSQDDFGYTRSGFSEVQRFFRKAADAERWVVFTTDQ